MCSQRALLSVDGEAQQAYTKSGELDTGMLACPTESIQKMDLAVSTPTLCPQTSQLCGEICRSKSQIGVIKVSFVFADSNDFSRHEFV